MANINAPRGFTPKRHLDGSPYNQQNVYALIPSTDATATSVGDVVKFTGTSGAAGVTVNGMDMEGVPIVARATVGTTGQDIFGVVVGFLPDPTNLGNIGRTASTNRVALVSNDPTTVYEVQEDTLVTPIVAASIGLNAAYTLTAGSATTGRSGFLLDSDSVNTTVTLPLKIIGLTKRSDNAFNTGGAGTDPAKFDVIFNTYLVAPNTLGV